VPAHAGFPAARSGDVAGTLRLLAYLGLAIALMAFVQRGGWLQQVRRQGELAMQPLWWLAGLPGRVGDGVRDTAATRARLAAENRALRNALLVSGARMARLQAAAAETERMRGLLGAAQRGRLDVQLVPILDIDLDPSRQRLVLDAGTRDGVRVGQSVIDAGGLLGQIIAATPTTSTVLLLTDPDHALPVTVARSGVRLVAYGSGRNDRLTLANIPLSGDIRVGDSIVSSGLGGRFPAGFPVGTVTALRPDDSRAFLVGDLAPAAQLDRGRDVLVLRRAPAPPVPPPPADAAATGTAGKAVAQAGAEAPGPADASPAARDPSPPRPREGDAPTPATPRPEPRR
jgi:rod shape-determining protein MreC